jgi:hypothetical protein
MGIYESELSCGCIAEWKTYETPSKSYVKRLCAKHAPVVSNVMKYNLRDFRRRYVVDVVDERGLQDVYKDIRILGTSPVQKRRSIIVRFEILDPDFDISSFRNPVYFSEFEGAPAFQRRSDEVVECIDLFDATLVYVPGL